MSNETDMSIDLHDSADELLDGPLDPADAPAEIGDRPMELRVGFANGRQHRANLVEGLTLGRSGACGVVLDDAEVGSIHAIITRDLEGTFYANGVGGLRIALADGSYRDQVRLYSGLRFYIGIVRVLCVNREIPTASVAAVAKSGAAFKSIAGGTIASDSAAARETGSLLADSSPAAPWAAQPSPPAEGHALVMGELAAEAVSPEWAANMEAVGLSGAIAWTQPDESGLPAPVLVACPACRAPLAGLGGLGAARFCPTCGGALPLRDPTGLLLPPEQGSPLYDVYVALREELGAKLAGQTPRQASSLIVLGYANALLNLGWRYEHGKGIMRNIEEAARCYTKAGRLAAGQK